MTTHTTYEYILIFLYVCVRFVFEVQHYRRAYSDNERNQLYLWCRMSASSCIYIADLSFQRPSVRMLTYCPERINLHWPYYCFIPLRHCQFSSSATSCGLQFISFALHYCTIILWTLMWHANVNLEIQDSVQTSLNEKCNNKHKKGPCFFMYVPCVLYSLLYSPINAQYIYILTIFYIS